MVSAQPYESTPNAKGCTATGLLHIWPSQSTRKSCSWHEWRCGKHRATLSQAPSYPPHITSPSWAPLCPLHVTSLPQAPSCLHHIPSLSWTETDKKLETEIMQLKCDLGAAYTYTNTDFSWLNKPLVWSTLVPPCRKIFQSFSQWMGSFSISLLALQHLLPIYKDEKLILKISLTVSKVFLPEGCLTAMIRAILLLAA